MTHPLLSDPENAKAYQTLCEHPRGSTRAWAAKAGWTHSKMRTFLENLELADLGKVEALRYGSFFIPQSHKIAQVDTSSHKIAQPDQVLTATADKQQLRSAGAREKTERPIADQDSARLIAALNAGFACRPESQWNPVAETNPSSVAAAQKILRTVPVDRAIPLLEQACAQFNPSHSGNQWPHSLGHPFFYKFVARAYRTAQRELDAGQLPILFSSGPTYQEYKPEPEGPTARTETIDAVCQEWRSVLPKPRRA